MTSTAVVIGGGVAGLAAARRLAMSGFADVTVLEAGQRLGGKIAPVELDGVRLDCGAESMLARRPEAVRLIADLGLEAEIVHPTPATAQILLDGTIKRLPPSAMGIPNDLDVLEGFLTDAGVRRARQEPSLPAPPLDGDVGIGRYVADRFGDEVTDRLLEPLLGGVYAGHSRDLSFAAVAPALFERARTGGSLLEHARSLPAPTGQGPVFAGLVGGVNGLVAALVEDLDRRGVVIRTGVTVRRLARSADARFTLECGPVPAPETLTADAVVVATPARATGSLLAETVGEPARAFAETPYASMAVVTLVVGGAELSGSGLLVPPGQLPTIKALTYSSRKWEWTGSAAEARWGDGTDVVRASIGRFGETALLQLGDAALVERTWAEAHESVPGWASGSLVTAAVQRWGGGLPQYLVGHRDRVRDLRTAVDAVDGLAICGAALDGVGIPACVGTAEAAVDQLTSQS